jgi:hypothetical protein
MPKGPQVSVEVVYLEPHESYPASGDDDPWLRVEPFDDDGKFYGTGGATKPSGEWVGYASLAENDVNLDMALAAAREWAEKYKVPVIHVRTKPEHEHS